jgi:fructose/tagatose bisphosphate aldolase
MTLASPKKLLENQSVVLGFNVIGLEHAEAYVAAAEQAGQGLILQLSENAVKYRGALGPIGSALLVIAEQSKQPISVMLKVAVGIVALVPCAEFPIGRLAGFYSNMTRFSTSASEPPATPIAL